ncbi:hypothetical protein AAFF_G00391000 [Aldrovandia affinis]|uniref:Immunoglobulin subtype domain-containing protein n=1 Tax=Aldrovandia affinis TaxID=143900 RepID=A0AAD7VZ82_9TELE|nr:hypothetical protein AAFF_G00391000 [Aldrovandia affinis]
MDGSCIAAVFWLCVCLSLQHRASGETVLRPVKAGANITLHCDVKNRCIKFEMNHSTGSIDLKIQNFSDSNLGFYYCATTFIDKDGKDDRLNGNITTKLVYAGELTVS